MKCVCTISIFRGEVKDTRLEAKAKIQKNSETKANNSPSKDRLSRDQEQECSRPKTQAQVFSKKKWSSKKIFRRSPDKKNKDLKKFFPAISKKINKWSSKKFFRQCPLEESKKGLRKFSERFLAFSNKILTVKKTVLSSS